MYEFLLMTQPVDISAGVNKLVAIIEFGKYPVAGYTAFDTGELIVDAVVQIYRISFTNYINYLDRGSMIKIEEMINVIKSNPINLKISKKEWDEEIESRNRKWSTVNIEAPRYYK